MKTKLTLLLATVLLANTAFGRFHVRTSHQTELGPYWYLGLIIPLLLLSFAVYSAVRKRK